MNASTQWAMHNPILGDLDSFWDPHLYLDTSFSNIYPEDELVESPTSGTSGSMSLPSSPRTCFSDTTPIKTEPHPNHGDGEGLEQPARQSKPSSRRKRPNRYKNATPEVLEKRRAQNRNSQRAYRERKEQRISDLETELTEAKHRIKTLDCGYRELQARYLSLQKLCMLERGQAAM